MRIVFIFLITCMVTCCGYVDEYSLSFVPKKGVGFAENKIGTLNVYTRILASDHSDSTTYFFYVKNRPKGPYHLHLRARDETKIPLKIIIHSLIFSNEFTGASVTLFSQDKNQLELQFEEATNVDGKLLGWDTGYLFKNQPIDVPFSNEQFLNVKFDITVIYEESRKRQKVHFPFIAKLIERKAFIPLWSMYGR